MGIPKWVKADFIEDFPLMIASSGIGAIVGLLIGSKSGHSSSHLTVLWIVGSVVLTIAGFGLWLYRGAKRHEKNPDRIGFPEVHREIAELREVVALHIPGVTQDHEILVKEGDAEPVPMASATVPAGASVSSAIGAGPLTFTVPSGGVFGTSPNGVVHFTLPEGQTIVLPDGGTVAAQLFAKIESVSTVKAELTVGKKDEDGL